MLSHVELGLCIEITKPSWVHQEGRGVKLQRRRLIPVAVVIMIFMGVLELLGDIAG